MANSPSLNGPETGRDPKTGCFRPGWKGGPGNPHSRSVQMIRSEITSFLTEERVQALVQMLYDEAINEGNVAAAKELLDRALGKAPAKLDVDFGVRDYSSMAAFELIAECERLDQEREDEGLAPHLVAELPAALKEMRAKRIEAEGA